MQILTWSYDTISLFAVIILLRGGSCNLSFSNEDFCQKFSGRRILVKPGEVQEIKFEKLAREPDVNDSDSSSQICRIELITWHNCHFVVTFLNTDLPRCSTVGICRCDYISVRQPEYKKTYVEYCGVYTNSSVSYESKNKIIILNFVYGSPFRGTFAAQIRSLRNIYTVRGRHDHYNLNSSGYLESPYFPYIYPTDYSADYVLENDDPKGFVQLIFTDFYLSQWSEVHVYDTNGSRIGTFTGNTFRPPVLYSTGRNMTVKFEANDEYPNIGFRANYNFISYVGRYMLSKPNTDCGGSLDDSGGVIILRNIVEGSRAQLYDCIWIVHPNSAYGTQLSLQVTQFEDIGTKPVLKIHRGLTSKSPLIAAVKKLEYRIIRQEHIVPLRDGLYLRLQGFFNNKSKVEMIYTAFHYDVCPPAKNFRCSNGRCIDVLLRCDGYNHCGDGSDEKSCLSFEATVNPEDGTWWRTLTPNYYFPKQESSGTSTNMIILVTSLVGLGLFILTTTLILIKLHKQRSEDSNMHQALHTISQDVDAHGFQRPGEPPLYDPPPSYDDVIKFYLAPPPTYTTVASSDAENSPGIENAAFVPDTEPPRTTVVEPPSFLTSLFPRRVQKSNSSASEKQKETAESVPSADHANCDNKVASDPESEKNTAEKPPFCVSEPAVVEKCCICEGACNCPLSKSIIGLEDDIQKEALPFLLDEVSLPCEFLSVEERSPVNEEISSLAKSSDSSQA